MVQAAESGHFSLKDLSAMVASWRNRLYQPGREAGRILGMRAAGRPVLKGFLIMAVTVWMSPRGARAGYNKRSTRNRASRCAARNPV